MYIIELPGATFNKQRGPCTWLESKFTLVKDAAVMGIGQSSHVRAHTLGDIRPWNYYGSCKDCLWVMKQAMLPCQGQAPLQLSLIQKYSRLIDVIESLNRESLLAWKCFLDNKSLQSLINNLSPIDLNKNLGGGSMEAQKFEGLVAVILAWPQNFGLKLRLSWIHRIISTPTVA